MFKAKIFKSDLVFILLFVIFAIFYYDSVLDKGPLNAHLWRQTDCLSMTKNYADGANFLSPEMHILLGDDNTTGKSVGEFPILYYAVGTVWKLVGESYTSFRLFYLLIMFFGVFAFYKSIRLVFKDQLTAIFLALLLFTSPVFVVYGVSFLTDVPAFCFVLIALYYFVRYHQETAYKFLYLSMGFFALAGLIKVSSLIAFLFLFGVLIFELLPIKTLGTKKLFHGRKHEWIAFGSVFLAVFAWYYYASYFNSLHGFKYTFNGVWPIWDLAEGEWEIMVDGIKNFTSLVFFSRPMLFLLGAVGIFNLFTWKRVPLLVYMANLIIILGGIAYCLLWALAMDEHDYYYVALLILFVGVLVPFAWFLKTNPPKKSIRTGVKIAATVFLVYNFLYCMNVVKLKTLAQEGDFMIVGNKKFVDKMKWTNWDVSVNWNRFSHMKPYVRELGIKKEDKIISLPDFSFNTTLVLLDQKGWTNFSNYDGPGIRTLIEKDAKYLFISSDALLKMDYIQPFITDQIGEFQGVKIYKLSKEMGKDPTEAD